MPGDQLRRRIGGWHDPRMKIADGIHRVGPGVVNVYLVEEAGEGTIIDARMSRGWTHLPRELAGVGRTLDDVPARVLTHGHPAPIGLAGRGRTAPRRIGCSRATASPGRAASPKRSAGSAPRDPEGWVDPPPDGEEPPAAFEARGRRGRGGKRAGATTASRRPSSGSLRRS